MKSVTWNELDLQEQNLLAAAYGQISIAGYVFEVNVIDPRFSTENSLPWDAEAFVNLGVDGKVRLCLRGWQEPSGRGRIWDMTLPEDVILSVHFWEEESEPVIPLIQQISEINKKILDLIEGMDHLTNDLKKDFLSR